MMVDSKEITSSRHKADAHVNLETADSMHKTCTSLSQTKSRKERNKVIPTHNQEAICNWQLLGERKKQKHFSSRKYIKLGTLTAPHHRPHDQEYLTNKLKPILCVCVRACVCFPFLILLVTDYLFPIFSWVQLIYIGQSCTFRLSVHLHLE